VLAIYQRLSTLYHSVSMTAGSGQNAVGAPAFKRQLWQCMAAMAFKVKAEVERYRGRNTFGLLTWQLNEIWPTGGWGSIEYGGARAGQVVGGRWKPLHYLYRRSLYADVMCTCGECL
jgi:beta-mannosidase